MTTIGLSYSLVKISTKCAPALTVPGGMTTLEYERRNGSVKNFGDYIASMYINKNCATKEIKEAINKYGYTIDVKVVAHDTNEIISSKTMKYCK